MNPSPPLAAPDAPLPDWARRHINLADAVLGAEAVACSDDFFAPMARLLQTRPAIFIPDKYDDNGKWMDGWESRRRRDEGHDWCIVRLARPGRIAGVDIDTSFFTGNFPPAASLDGCREGGDPARDTDWESLLPPTALSGNQHHLMPLNAGDVTYSHVRLNILPDGGVARLRIYGRPTGEPEPGADGLIDLGATLNGGHPVAWNDAHFGAAANLLRPGRGVDMGDGWETRRRREPGFDWCIIALGRPGRVRRIEVDTAHFKGNYPDRCSLQATYAPDLGGDALVAQAQFWPTLLGDTKLEADRIHTFEAGIAPLGTISHIRLNLHPDGGVSRLRVWGEVVPA